MDDAVYSSTGQWRESSHSQRQADRVETPAMKNEISLVVETAEGVGEVSLHAIKDSMWVSLHLLDPLNGCRIGGRVDFKVPRAYTSKHILMRIHGLRDAL